MKKIMIILSITLVLGLTGCNFLPDLEPTTIAVDTTNYLEVSTVDQLKEMDLNQSYQLIADIDLDGEDWVPIGDIDTPFQGNFNGNGHTISNLSINDNHMGFNGLFGYLKGDVEDLNIINFTIDIDDNFVINAGGLAGMSLGSINDVHVDGTIQVASEGFNVYTGLLVGNQHTLPQAAVDGDDFTPNEIKNNSARGSIVVGEGTIVYAGGLFGKSHNSRIYKNEIIDLILNVDGFDIGFVGGLLGQNFLYDFEASYQILVSDFLVYENIVNVVFDFDQGDVLTMGGLIGYNQNAGVNHNFVQLSSTVNDTPFIMGLIIGEHWGSRVEDNLAILTGFANRDASEGALAQLIGKTYDNLSPSGYVVSETDVELRDENASIKSLADVQGNDFYALYFSEVEEALILRMKEIFFEE